MACSSPADNAGAQAEDACSPAHIRELAQTDYEAAMKLTAEGLRSGFYTIRTFQRSFLAVTGKTPSEYAQNLKENN